MHPAASRILVQCSRGLLTAALVVTPLVVFPWTVDALDINKQTLAIVAIIAAAVMWLGAMLLTRAATFRASWLYAPLVGFLLASLVSAALSVAPYTSLVGQGTQEYTSVLTLLMQGGVFVLGAHLFAPAGAQRRLWFWLLIVSAIVAVLGALPFLGEAMASYAVNTIGTPNAFGLFLVTIATLGCGLWLAHGDDDDDVLPVGVWGMVARAVIILITLLAIAVLLALDYTVLWVAAMVGALVLMTFALTRASAFPHPGRFVLPMLMFVVSLMFVFFPTVIQSPYAPEVAPTASATWEIATKGMGDTSYLFGSGPGTFTYAYAKFHAPEISQTSFWDVRFDRGASHIVTMLGTFGIVPTVFFLAFVVLLGVLAVTRLVRERNHAEWKLTYAPFAAWCVLVIAMTMYPSNMTLAMLFWTLSAVLAAHVLPVAREFAFVRSPRAGLVAAFAFVLAAVGMLTTLFVTVSRYRAEIAYARAVAADRQGGDIDEIIAYLDRAATTNRWSDVYFRNLGSALLHKTADVIGDDAADPTFVRSLIASAITAAGRATELGSANVVNWSLRGDIYREVAPVVPDADAFAITAYETAITLEPANPSHYVDLARAYLVRADLLAPLFDADDALLADSARFKYDDALALAEVSLKTATTLRPEDANALYYLAFVHERKGELSEAVRTMELVRATNPSDVGVGMQLALLYLRQGKHALAKAELERVISIAPNYANAHWYLATILEQEDDIMGALAALGVVRELNPDNAAVASRIAELEAGLLAPEPIPEPLEDDAETGVLPE